MGAIEYHVVQGGLVDVATLRILDSRPDASDAFSTVVGAPVAPLSPRRGRTAVKHLSVRAGEIDVVGGRVVAASLRRLDEQLEPTEMAFVAFLSRSPLAPSLLQNAIVYHVRLLTIHFILWSYTIPLLVQYHFYRGF